MQCRDFLRSIYKTGLKTMLTKKQSQFQNTKNVDITPKTQKWRSKTAPKKRNKPNLDNFLIMEIIACWPQKKPIVFAMGFSKGIFTSYRAYPLTGSFSRGWAS